MSMHVFCTLLFVFIIDVVVIVIRGYIASRSIYLVTKKMSPPYTSYLAAILPPVRDLAGQTCCLGCKAILVVLFFL